ncbi:MAG: MBL fold metallo-hydrolase [Candidatus Aminicenantes bacterium]|nr:MBL fold metallo-hydrolase [Candidatus Aminicenantes bacterium]
MKHETVVVGALETNCYLVYCEESLEGIVVDPGADPHKIFAAIAEIGVKPGMILNTHGHIDHVGANKDIKDHYDIPLYIHEDDAVMLQNGLQSEIAFLLNAHPSPEPDGYLVEGQVLNFGSSQLTVIPTPGHSPGSISLRGEDCLFSGDTLFYGGVGRTDLPGGSWDELVDSIRSRIFVLPDDTVVLPGHGPATTVGQEKDINPYVR